MAATPLPTKVSSSFYYTSTLYISAQLSQMEMVHPVVWCCDQWCICVVCRTLTLWSVWPVWRRTKLLKLMVHFTQATVWNAGKSTHWTGWKVSWPFSVVYSIDYR